MGSLGSAPSRNKMFCGVYVQHGVCFVYPLSLCMQTFCRNVCGVMKPNGSTNAVHRKPPEATKGKHIFLEDKLDVIKQVEKGKKQMDVVMAFGSSKQSVNTIISAKKAILAKKVLGH